MLRTQRFFRVAVLLLSCVPWGHVCALDQVSLQLKWTHAFQFAGYYAAKEKGFYAEAGLDVTLNEATPGVDPTQAVLGGKAEYGVGNSSLLLARKGGAQVVVLAVIFQHSPLVLIAREDKKAQDVHDLIGKRIMLEPQSDELLAYLKQEGIPLDSLTFLPHSFDPADLISGKVDAISAYITNETHILDQADQPYQIYTPRSVGIDFYGDNLFTTERELRDHPARVAAFRAASLRGWQYAMAHPVEVADMILAHYSDRHTREFLLNEANRMAPLLRPDLIEPGYMNVGRWRHIVQTYADLGLLPRDFSLEGFLYRTEIPVDRRPLYVITVLLLISSLIAFYILSINRRLRQALVDARLTHEALRVSEERHRLLADNATDVIWTMDLEGHFTYISPSVERLRGYTPAEAMRQTLEEALTPESARIAREALGRALISIHAGSDVADFRGELEQSRKDGCTAWTETTVTAIRGPDGRFYGLLGVSRDISERRQAESCMRHLAEFDSLTDLPNRLLFSDRLKVALARVKREHSRLALMFVDLDCFKPINDNHGHAVGDVVLQEVARRMRQAVRESDTVARIGGDEFVVLLPVVADAESAVQVAEKIRQALHVPFAVGQLELGLSCSIGIALAPDHGSDEIVLAKQADQAMYRAKNEGKDRVAFAG